MTRENTATDPHGGTATVINPNGSGDVVLVCEHATNFIPDEFAGLGLTQDARDSHIAWDIGAFKVAVELSAAFDAPLVAPSVSRLLYDCNRAPEIFSAIPEKSEIYPIPGNVGLSASDRQLRARCFYEPFYKALTTILDAPARKARTRAFVTVHSFTPVYEGRPRDVEIGVLHDRDSRLADALLDVFAADAGLRALRNEPYGPGDDVTHTLVEHALPRALPNVMIEIRNDLIADENGQGEMAGRLEQAIRAALEKLDPPQIREASQ